MHTFTRCWIVLIAVAAASPAAQAQHAEHGGETTAHKMLVAPLGGGWRLSGMAQAFPIVTIGAPLSSDSPLHRSGWYLTQPVVMAVLSGPDERFTVRATLDFEGMTQPDGELTFGGWGEGFIDARHPHTLLHELMLGVNAWDIAGGALSLSAGKGFAPYGTPDPMARPGLKYPTNHHLSQILERWTLNGAYVRAGWSLEAGLFAGREPDGPYDLSGLEQFGDSWSARIARHWGGGAAPFAAWEAAASFGRVKEEHDGETERTSLWNLSLRHTRTLGTAGEVYGMMEASRSDPSSGDGYFSVLLESRLRTGRHQPYARVEYATRPEYERVGAPGTAEFFRYEHDEHAIGATRWFIATAAYAVEATAYPISVRPFVEAQFHRVRDERGGIDPRALYGETSFWSVTLGARIFLGGDPMRMGSYGVLDPMTAMQRDMAGGEPMQSGGR